MSRPSDPRQISLLPPDAAAIIHLVRENLRVLRELVQRHEIPWLDAAGEGVTLRSPADVAAYLGPEMAELGQEQLRVVLLNTKNRVVGAVLVYQGTIDSRVGRRPRSSGRSSRRTGWPACAASRSRPRSTRRWRCCARRPATSS